MLPQYFFHLVFELYPPPSSDSPSSSEHDLFLPPQGTDIFEAALPAHRLASWSTPELSKKGHRRTRTGGADSGAIRPNSQRRFSNLSPTSPGDRRDRPVPAYAQRSLAKSHVDATGRDWRFDNIRIQSIDMERREDEAIRQRGKSASKPLAGAQGGLSTKARYVPSNSKDTDVGWGVVHLYRDIDETPGLYTDGTSSSGSDNGQPDPEETPAFDEEDCSTLCILAVPSYLTPSDLLGFVGEQTREEVSHFRFIKTRRANRYMVLMRFRDAKAAREWRKKWNGKLFNSMDGEYCHVVFVKSIEFQSNDNRDPSSFPNMNNDPFTPLARAEPAAPLPANASSPVESSAIVSSLSIRPLAPPPSTVELPTCPVCLERMDETTGLLTILCQHVFHCACLEKWRGSGCPVCRYTQSDAIKSRNQREEESGAARPSECSVCGSTDNLWICLICGNVGCGRYDSAHAFAHYEATSHTYAMDITSQHVWDYAGDGYVHRLIQNKADGKLVDLPAAYSNDPRQNMTGYGGDTVPREKLENMGVEYAYLLTSQLDSQRSYFEEQVDRAVDKAAMASAAAEKAASSVEKMSSQLNVLQIEHQEAKQTIASLEKDAHRHSSRAEKMDGLARKFGKDLREEKSMNEALSQKVTFLEGKVKQLEDDKKDLEEQNRDLTFFISSSEKLKAAGASEDVVEGTVEVGAAPEEKKKKGKRRK